MQIQSRRESSNDHAFEALLQSQRELLSQMKYGTPVKWGSHSNTANNTSQECGFEKLVFNRRSSLDKLFPSVLTTKKSISGTTHDDTYKLPSLDNLDLKSGCRSYPAKHKIDAVSDPKKRKQSSSCLSTTGLIDDDTLPMKPDFSESSERSFELDFELLDFNDVSSLIEEKEGSDIMEVENADEKLEKQTESTLATEPETDDDDDVPLEVDEIDQQEKVPSDPEEVKKIVQAFRVAMERSQYTQHAIHDWDKKMGLKRSHSKTMRLSARSRKKLRTMFKREFNVSVLA